MGCSYYKQVAGKMRNFLLDETFSHDLPADCFI